MGIAETALIVIALVLMVIGVLLTFMPFLPGPMIVWAVGFVYTLIDGFEHVGLLALGVMTLLMIAGSTSELWMQLMGLQMHGTSCLSTLGSVVGGVVGTFVIPIPLLGTVAGMVIGALLFEFARQGELDPALQAGRNAFKVYLISTLAEFAAAVLILLVFILSLYLNS
jgi:uncharacterized protein YqgC (DUF456 family)